MAVDYESVAVVDARCLPGVSFSIRRVSFGRRIELMRRVREIAAKIECLEAGSDPREKIEANLLSSEIDRTYLLWGLEKIEGLAVDGVAATPESVIEAGPEELCGEILTAIKRELRLGEEERKN